MEGFQMAPILSRALIKHFTARYVDDKADYVSAEYFDDPARFTVQYKGFELSLRMGRTGIYYTVGDYFHGRYAAFSRDMEEKELSQKLISDMELMLYSVPWFEDYLIQDKRCCDGSNTAKLNHSLKFARDFRAALSCFLGQEALRNSNLIREDDYDDYDI